MDIPSSISRDSANMLLRKSMHHDHSSALIESVQRLLEPTILAEIERCLKAEVLSLRDTFNPFAIDLMAKNDGIVTDSRALEQTFRVVSQCISTITS